MHTSTYNDTTAAYFVKRHAYYIAPERMCECELILYIVYGYAQFTCNQRGWRECFVEQF